MKRWLLCGLCVLGLLLLGACAAAQTDAPVRVDATPTGTVAWTLSSPAFAAGQDIPVRYTCDGEDLSPPLRWSDPPEGTRSLALIMDDPDAPLGTWTHWVLFNLPPDQQVLAEGLPPRNKLDNGAVQGKNSWRRFGYGGPCPPTGTHRYRFTLYALDTVLDLGPGTDADRLRQAMAGHVLAESRLEALYGR